ncbi:hypothetical protein M0R45_038503 [Rubus argutus]|uniref:Uncharacterized protein n=1 Tax=Rubus argutus TaxID=59490 RepID=A0AAW1W3H2_RUBAR
MTTVQIRQPAYTQATILASLCTQATSQLLHNTMTSPIHHQTLASSLLCPQSHHTHNQTHKTHHHFTSISRPSHPATITFHLHNSQPFCLLTQINQNLQKYHKPHQSITPHHDLTSPKPNQFQNTINLSIPTLQTQSTLPKTEIHFEKKKEKKSCRSRQAQPHQSTRPPPSSTTFSHLITITDVSLLLCRAIPAAMNPAAVIPAKERKREDVTGNSITQTASLLAAQPSIQAGTSPTSTPISSIQ